MNFRKNDLNNLKVRRFLKAKTELTDEQLEVLVADLQQYKQEQVNLKIAFFKEGVTEYEYSRIRSINLKRGFIKLKNKMKIAVSDIVEIKKL
jgi:hypothetical protein